MKYMCFAFVALLAGTLASLVHAAPPTVTPSPGYDARLQEQRSATTIYTPAPRPPKARPKPKKPKH